MALPAPWNRVEKVFDSLQDFGAGSQLLGDLFKGMEEKHGPDEMLENLLAAKPTYKWMERFLFSLFDIGVSDKQIGTRALELRRLRRLWCRAVVSIPLSDEEDRLVQLIAPLFQSPPEERDAAVAAAKDAFARLIAGGEITPGEREALAKLIRCEAEALRDRVNWLSENADPYNMKTMARVLPRLRIYDEAVAEGLELAKKLESGAPVGVKILSFEMQMKGAFDKWSKKIAKPESLKTISDLIADQRVKKIPTIDLVSLCTLCRWTFEIAGEKSSPMDWITKAFKCYRDDGAFEVDAGEAAAILVSTLSSSGVKGDGTRVSGHFGKKLYPALVGRDLLTKTFMKAADEGLVDMKSVIAQNITRDSVLEALLNNPKVFQAPGLVAFIAQTSRSIGILSRIAKTRDLHNGFANRDVPLALLESPCNVPMSLLRPLINVRNVPVVELKRLAKAKAGVRREVRSEIEAYLKTRT